MPRVSYKGQVIDVPDSDAALLDYYVGDGGAVEGAQVAEQAVVDVPVGEGVAPEPVVAGAEPQQDAAAADSTATNSGDSADADSAPQPGPTADPAA